MWTFAILIFIILLLFLILIRHLNKNYFILAGCKRIKTVDGSDLEEKVTIIPGQTIFGNNFDVLDKNPVTLFKFIRDCKDYAKERSYLFYFLFAPIYNIVTAEDAEEILQSQLFIKKSVIYNLLQSFLGDGLLISTNEKWHFRRKMLTPAFHFNVLQGFLEVFKQESIKMLKVLNESAVQTLPLDDIVAEFTLNSVCETALGVKLDQVEGSARYRHAIHNIEMVNIFRTCKPLLYYDWIFYMYRKEYKLQQKHLKIAHEFSSKIIENKRQEYKKRMSQQATIEVDEFGKKQRYAMLDTLLAAESKGLIGHEGICEEVDTFMFEGYDTTATCLRFALLNLAWRQDVQERCYEELQQYHSLMDLTVFDFNQLEYLECVLKETLRLYPSVPFLARETTSEVQANGLILPAQTQINIHVFDIMRDARHFPEPNQFEPERFLPKNTTNRHPFAYIPFSAGPRNCIGQKFALLEMKLFLATIIKNFRILPVTRLEDIVLQNGMVIRTEQSIKVKLSKRNYTPCD